MSKPSQWSCKGDRLACIPLIGNERETKVTSHSDYSPYNFSLSLFLGRERKRKLIELTIDLKLERTETLCLFVKFVLLLPFLRIIMFQCNRNRSGYSLQLPSFSIHERWIVPSYFECLIYHFCHSSIPFWHQLYRFLFSIRSGLWLLYLSLIFTPISFLSLIIYHTLFHISIWSISCIRPFITTQLIISVDDPSIIIIPSSAFSYIVFTSIICSNIISESFLLMAEWSYSILLSSLIF